MGKQSIVEIPPGSKNFYRYEYEEGSGKTLYKGPVGTSPQISESEFNDLFPMTGDTRFNTQFGADPHSYHAFGEAVTVHEKALPNSFEFMGPATDWDQNQEAAEHMVDLANSLRVYHGITITTGQLIDWLNWTVDEGIEMRDAFELHVMTNDLMHKWEIMDLVYEEHSYFRQNIRPGMPGRKEPEVPFMERKFGPREARPEQ
jgi:hypothetical protein